MNVVEGLAKALVTTACLQIHSLQDTLLLVLRPSEKVVFVASGTP